MDTEIQTTNLLVFAYESTSVSDGLFFEIYTRMEISQEQAIEIAGTDYKKIPSISYRYVESKNDNHDLDGVFDLIFDAAAKSLWPDSDPESYIDNIRQLSVK